MYSNCFWQTTSELPPDQLPTTCQLLSDIPGSCTQQIYILLLLLLFIDHDNTHRARTYTYLTAVVD